jgi:predicted lipoprotein with Yx(FWY)xxD motif
MRLTSVCLAAAVLALAGCGSDDAEMPATAAAEETATPAPTAAPTATPTPTATPDRAKRRPARATRILAAGSDFGTMLFDARRQAIYVFELDSRNTTECYGECAEAWPPVFTKGKPVAGKGVDAGLLGTIERRDGRRQVTYAGKPLYYYAHEGRGEVRCHNVNLNGGFWWVVGPDGERRP